MRSINLRGFLLTSAWGMTPPTINTPRLKGRDAPMNNRNRKKGVVVYCRVASVEQADQGIALRAQEELCRSYAKQRGYEVVKIFADSGASGMSLNRPAFRRLLAYCKNHTKSVAAVLVTAFDRFTRSMKDGFELDRRFKKWGIKLAACSYPRQSSALDRFAKKVRSALAEYECERRREQSFEL